jgi:hypothetical protein
LNKPWLPLRAPADALGDDSLDAAAALPRRVPLFQVDAFTLRPFAGNSAAVCLFERPAGAEWMQRVAVEMNLSEMAFLVPRGELG